MTILRDIAARLPNQWQSELKRHYYRRQINTGTFITTEPEYKVVDQLLQPGDWVLDIGANVGHYTRRFSDLVGPKGRVIAFEPVPTTFALLAANVQAFKYRNVTLMNTAVSDGMRTLGITIPCNDHSRSLNYYQAKLSIGNEGSSLTVLTQSIDSFCLNHKVALVKIDVEGHEPFVIAGMERLLRGCKPTLIVECASGALTDNLTSIGYSAQTMKGSPNTLFTYN